MHFLLIAVLLERQPDLPKDPPRPIAGEIAVAPESPAPQAVPRIIAHPAGARALWLEGGALRIADFDRSGQRVAGAATIEENVERFFVAANSTDTLVAWQKDDSIAAIVVDRDREAVIRFPVMAMRDAVLTGVACITGECAIAWSLPNYNYQLRNAAHVQRFTASGTPIGDPIAVPDGTHLPWLVPGDGGYLVVLRAYDIGRSVHVVALLRDRSFSVKTGTGRSTGATAWWNGREWLFRNVPMSPYSTVDFTTSRLRADGTSSGSFAYDFEDPLTLHDAAWNGRAWVVALSDRNGFYAGAVDANGALRQHPVRIGTDISGWPDVSSAGDGLTWFAYLRDGRAVLRQVQLFR